MIVFKQLVALASLMPALSVCAAFSLVRERDSCERAEVTRWYDWGDTNRIGKVYTQMEGTLHYDFDLPETGWYTVSAQDLETNWDRTIALDGANAVERYTTEKRENANGWNKQFSIFLE